jgi:glutamate-ammonia-ligase adenylyltransferase
MGALCLAEKPRAGARARPSTSPPPRRCAAWCCPSCSASTWTTACSSRCARCTARSASTPAKRSAGRPERANDVKLSRGGIREIEFTVQLLQVVRGGQFPELRTRPTLAALERVARAGLMPPDTADALARAYVFLRRVEHRIQYLDDQQTHVLPTATRTWLDRPHPGLRARRPVPGRAGRAPRARGAGVRRPAGRRRAGVQGLRQGRRGRGPRPPRAGPCWRSSPSAPASAWPRNGATTRACRRCATRPRGRLLRLLQRTAQWLEEGRVSEDAVLRLADWVEPLLRRESYIALLLERPAVHERLLRVLGAARWPARYVLQHPGVIDELASPSLLDERFDAAAFEQELELRRGAGPHRRGRRGKPAQPAAPRPPRRGVPHPGARRRAAASASSRWPTTCRRWPTPSCA